MNIKEASARTNLPAKTIRYYEDIGLVQPDRNANGYRAFEESDIHKLAFIGRARGLGFTVEECRTLLHLYEDTTRTSAEVKSIALDHLSRIDQRIAEMKEMRKTLAHLVSCCAGDDRPNCPILDSLAADQSVKSG